MLSVAPGSTTALVALAVCFVLVCGFEFANGFHDTANAVATVIYTNALKPRQAVLWSALMNFLGVVMGGIAVAYALVELLPAEVLSPPDGSPAVPMLVALFSTALPWTVVTWWFGIPNSSSHCLIGALIGIAVGDAFVNARRVGDAVDWHQVWVVLRALAVSPILGLVGAAAVYLGLRQIVRDERLYETPRGDEPPPRWVRYLLILTCTSVSFSHGTNDGQKSIGLIMLTIIGLMPAVYALNADASAQARSLPQEARAAAALIARYGSDENQGALSAAQNLEQADVVLALEPSDAAAARRSKRAVTRSAIRDDVYRIIAALKRVRGAANATDADKAEAARLSDGLRPTVEYAPWWVRLLSATWLGLGTMIGYRRIVHTLGEGIGRTHLTPAQGASAELVGASLIATAGFTGLPVSTTHIITSGIAGTMITAGSGINQSMVTRIALTWVVTLPVTIVVAAALFYLLAR